MQLTVSAEVLTRHAKPGLQIEIGEFKAEIIHFIISFHFKTLVPPELLLHSEAGLQPLGPKKHNQHLSRCRETGRKVSKFSSVKEKKNPMKVQSRSKIRKPRHQRTAGSAGSSLSCQRAFPDKKLHGTSQCFSKVWKWKSHLAKSWWMLCPKSLKILPAGQELGQQEQPTFAASFSNIDFL